MKRLAVLPAGFLALLVMLTGCGLQAYDLPLPGKVVSSSKGYQVTADFADVVDVVPRTLVMANDVPVGQVDSIKRVGWHAEVKMTLRKDIVLPADAVADVRQTSLLGEKYISLEAPQGSTVAAKGRLADGAVIPLASTTRNPEVEEVLGALSLLLSGGGVGQLKTISTELNKMMDGRQDTIRDVLGRLTTLVGSLDQQKNDIINAMAQVNQLTATLNSEKSAIGTAIDSFGPALSVLRHQHQQLMTMLNSLDQLGVTATRVINASGANLTQTLNELQPTLTKLADANDSLPRGLMMLASFPFPSNAATLAKGDYSNSLFHMDFDLNKLFNGLATGTNAGLPEIIQLCATYAGASCGQLKPLFVALCNLTHEDLVCSALDQLGTGGSGSSGSGSSGGSGLPGLPSGGGSSSPPLGGLLGGGSGGGLLGGLLGGLGLRQEAGSP